MKLRAVLDACVLIPMPLADTLLQLAHTGLYRPVWSSALLEETRGNLIRKLDLPADRAGHRVETMRRAFPLAEVSPPAQLVEAMTVDVKDRHVAAAAITAGASLIVTYNLADFPDVALDPYGITAIHPDEFLLDLLDLDAGAVTIALEQQRRRLRSPAMPLEIFHQALAVNVPQFVDELASLPTSPATDGQDESAAADMPLPVVSRSHDEMRAAFFAEEVPDALTPWVVAYCWYTAIVDLGGPGALDSLQQLSVPGEWDYASIAESLKGFSLTEGRHRDTQQPWSVCYFKLIEADVAGQIFAHHEIRLPTQFLMLTRDDLFEHWRVFRFGPQPWHDIPHLGGPTPIGDLPPRR